MMRLAGVNVAGHFPFGEHRRVGRRARLHVSCRGHLLPASLYDEDAIILHLLTQRGVVIIRWPHGRERFIEMFVAEVPDQSAVDIFLFRVDVPRLCNGPWIDLSGEQVLAQRCV